MRLDFWNRAQHIDSDAMAAFDAGMTALHRGDINGAEREFLEAAKKKPDWWRPHSGLLEVYKLTGRLDEAMAENLTCCRLVPDEMKPNYYNSLGARYTEHKDVDRAMKAFQKAIELNPHYALPHANLAGAYLKKEDFEVALIEARKAVEIDSNLPDGHYFLGRAYLHKEDFGQALICLEKAIALKPVHHLWKTAKEQSSLRATISHLRSLTAMENHSLKDAIRNITEAIDLESDPRHLAELHRNLSVVLTAQGDHGKALTHGLEATRLDPEEGIYHYSLGVDFTNLKRWEEACSAYRKALELGLGPEVERQALHNLKYAEGVIGARSAESETLSRAGLKSAPEFLEETQLLNLSVPEGYAISEEQARKYAAIGASESAAWLYEFLARMYRTRGHMSNTLRCAAEACAQHRKGSARTDGLCGSLVLLAECHANLGDDKQALEQCYEVIRELSGRKWEAPAQGSGNTLASIVNKLVDRTLEMPHRLAVELLDIMGTVSHRTGDLANADLCFQGARRILERTEFWQEKASMLLQAGRSARDRGDYRSARDLFDRAVQVARTSNHEGNVIVAMTERSDIETYLENADLDQALAWIEDALRMENKSHHWDPGLVAHFFYTRGKVLQKRARNIGGASTEDILRAFIDYGTALELVEDMRVTISLDTQKIGFILDKLEAVHALIALCLDLDRQFPGRSFREKAFEYPERAKSRALLDLIESAQFTHPRRRGLES